MWFCFVRQSPQLKVILNSSSAQQIMSNLRNLLQSARPAKSDGVDAPRPNRKLVAKIVRALGSQDDRENAEALKTLSSLGPDAPSVIEAILRYEKERRTSKMPLTSPIILAMLVLEAVKFLG